MLSEIVIDSFMRVPMATIKLSPHVNVFWGDNEAGKSTVAEAIRFVLRGVSERVSRKSDYDELLTTGRRSGSVEAVINGSVVRRNIRDGKTTTEFGLNFDDGHVDLQLGAEEFQLYDRKKLRALIMRILDVPKDREFITKRLKDEGVDGVVLDDSISMIFRAGFDATSKHAENEVSTKRGEWKGVTGEMWGTVKGAEWQHHMSRVALPPEQDIINLRTALKSLEAQRQIANRSLGAATQTLKLRGQIKNQISVADAEVALKVAQDSLVDINEQLETTVRDFHSGLMKARELFRQCDHQLADARRSQNTLKCPACSVGLKAVTKAGLVVLERTEEVAQQSESVPAATEALEAARKQVEALQNDEATTLSGLRSIKSQREQDVAREQQLLNTAKQLSQLPEVPEGEVERLTKLAGELAEQIEATRNEITRLEVTREQIKQAQNDTARARVIHTQAMQWVVVQKACGQGQGSIPAEMLARTTEPINAVMRQICQWWGYHPVVLDEELGLVSAGFRYGMGSKSSRWRANACMQLALAALSKLKIVVLDGFDILQATRRADYFRMLSSYSQAYPDVRILTMGTVTAAPPPFEGVKFFRVADGTVEACV